MPLNFLDLPAEIRNLVYSHLYVHHDPIFPFSHRQPPGQCRDYFNLRFPLRPTLRLNLLLTCRQIRDEASVILYGRNTFRFIREGSKIEGPNLTRRFMEIIGPDNRRRVKHVELSLETWDKGSVMFCEPESHLAVALAVLVTCFQLRVLTFTFTFPGLKYEFDYVFENSSETGRGRLLRQTLLDLSATIKAFEQCHPEWP